MQMDRMDVVARVAHPQELPLSFFKMIGTTRYLEKLVRLLQLRTKHWT
jgi:hypothetical protein